MPAPLLSVFTRWRLTEDGELVLIGCEAATPGYLPPPGEAIGEVTSAAAGASTGPAAEHFTGDLFDARLGSGAVVPPVGASAGAFQGHWLLHRCRKDDLVRCTL